VSSKCNQAPLNQIPSILENFTQILPNSIEFQTLQLPQFLIQILSGILKSSTKESCPLFNSLQIHILFENFQARKLYLLIELIQNRLNILNK
jgi:hypothetical protein